MRWNNCQVRPGGILLDEDISSTSLADKIRTALRCDVYDPSSPELGYGLEDRFLATLAVERCLLIVTRNGRDFREYSGRCGGLLNVAENDPEVVDRLVMKVLRKVKPDVLLHSYVSATRTEVAVYPQNAPHFTFDPRH